MRSIVYSGVFAVLAASSAMGQIAPAGKPPKMTPLEATTTAVTKLEDAWANALVHRDRATFERMLAPKFIYTEDSVTIDRATLLRGIFADVVTEAHNDSMEVHPFGNTAIVTGWLVVTGSAKDGPFERRYRFTDVWMPRSGSWQIVAAHDYLVPAKK
jgi:ketosteroid isomerase-like protein